MKKSNWGFKRAGDFADSNLRYPLIFENINDFIEMAIKRQIGVFLIPLMFSKMSGYLRIPRAYRVSGNSCRFSETFPMPYLNDIATVAF